MKVAENNPGAAHVPAQETGAKMDAVEKIELNLAAEAIHFFLDRPMDNLRNTFVVWGAKIGFSYPQVC